MSITTILSPQATQNPKATATLGCVYIKQCLIVISHMGYLDTCDYHSLSKNQYSHIVDLADPVTQVTLVAPVTPVTLMTPVKLVTLARLTSVTWTRRVAVIP